MAAARIVHGNEQRNARKELQEREWKSFVAVCVPFFSLLSFLGAQNRLLCLGCHSVKKKKKEKERERFFFLLSLEGGEKKQEAIRLSSLCLTRQAEISPSANQPSLLFFSHPFPATAKKGSPFRGQYRHELKEERGKEKHPQRKKDEWRKKEVQNGEAE